MRQPTFRRSRARQQRLIRTGIGITLLVGVAALVANLATTETPPDEPLPTPQVAFATDVTTHAATGSLLEADTISNARRDAEVRAITDLLDDWYQRTFVDPEVFEVSTDADGVAESFPPEDAWNLFAGGIRDDAVSDMDTLTLGADRLLFERVEPSETTADMTLLFRTRRAPKLAVVVVRFEALGLLKDEAPDVRISHAATFHLEHDGDRWQIIFYEAEQTQKSLEPTPTPTESS